MANNSNGTFENMSVDALISDLSEQEKNNLPKNVPVTKQTDVREVTALIHRYSFIHAAVAFVLGPFAGPFLTPITIKMISDIGEHCGVNDSEREFTNLASKYGGLILGVSLAYGIGALIPVIGNLSNAISSFIVTQIIGRASFKLFTGNVHIEFEKLKREDWEEIIGKVFGSSINDKNKKKFADLLVELFDKDSKVQIKGVQNQIKKIILSYKEEDILKKYKLTKENLKEKFWDYLKMNESNEFRSRLDQITNSEEFKTAYDNMEVNDKKRCFMCMEIILGDACNYEEQKRLNAPIEMIDILKRYNINI